MGWNQGDSNCGENIMDKGNITFCIGLPRSGKTSYCMNWVKELSDKPRAIVNADSIRLALTGERFNGFAEGMINQLKILQIKANLINGFDVMVDGTHTTWKSVKELLAIDPDAKYVFISADAYTCRRRANESNQEDLHPIIDRMAKQLDEIKPRFAETINTLREEAKNQNAPRIQQS